jgi:hypothetical protein
MVTRGLSWVFKAVLTGTVLKPILGRWTVFVGKQINIPAMILFWCTYMIGEFIRLREQWKLYILEAFGNMRDEDFVLVGTTRGTGRCGFEVFEEGLT